MRNVENYPGPSSEPDTQQPEEHPNEANPEQVQPVSKDDQAVHKKRESRKKARSAQAGQ
jgi:hypothetical protein